MYLARTDDSEAGQKPDQGAGIGKVPPPPPAYVTPSEKKKRQRRMDARSEKSDKDSVRDDLENVPEVAASMEDRPAQ
jgi:hypothetical protein